MSTLVAPTLADKGGREQGGSMGPPITGHDAISRDNRFMHNWRVSQDLVAHAGTWRGAHDGCQFGARRDAQLREDPVQMVADGPVR